MENTNIAHSLRFARSPEGRMVTAYEVPQGLACGCTCPGCNEALICRKGNKRIHHFAHYRSLECATAGESAAHMMAKQVIAESLELMLPECRVELSGLNRWGHAIERQTVIKPDHVARIQSSQVETRCGEFIPDVKLRLADESLLLVEIKVTHGIDDLKAQKLRAFNSRCLEIRLTQSEQVLGIEEFREAVLNTAAREWAFYPGRVEAEKKLLAWFEAEAEEAAKISSRYVECRPLGSCGQRSSLASSEPKGEPIDHALLVTVHQAYQELRHSVAERLVGDYNEDRDQLILIADIDLISRQLWRELKSMNYMSVVTSFDMDLTHQGQMQRLLTRGGLSGIPVRFDDLCHAYQSLCRRASSICT